MTLSKAIAKRIEDLCSERNITINKLATLAGFHRSTLEHIIKDSVKDPRVKTLYKIATALNMTISELLDFPEMNEIVFDEE
jgi:transcriptional regulator with XRE-family HTH domain